ncbi:rod-binding protein [Campylobacter sp. CCS1377]|uniref:Rod-binding protein n=1 Tax=Campylobacter sp. CCS1377 TaxID=3158229 RepID=A0AAU7E7S3_9BACT
MRVDNFLATYNANNPLLENVAKNSSSLQAVKNYASVKYKVNENEVVANSDYDKALKEQTDAFEAFLIKSVLDVSLKEKASLFGKDASDEIYSSMYNDTMSKALSGGLGFSKLLFDFLKERS